MKIIAAHRLVPYTQLHTCPLSLHARSLLNRTRKGGAAQPSGMLGALKWGIALGKALQTLPSHSEHTMTEKAVRFCTALRESLRKLSVGRNLLKLRGTSSRGRD